MLSRLGSGLVCLGEAPADLSRSKMNGLLNLSYTFREFR